ncbi:electron transport complex subunit RsxG [Hahella sp. CR1]|uniref:electron transport complex subunit RsxG n=1 Tax=unclassified Hahella TaxID=2624107 RepID=UPI00244225F8|nr:electron transport complex subunit RsxG [Hahella sp. CR1]MDG9671764.1 electron transport complex subunit RsxG [Hahella sp. CR1]
MNALQASIIRGGIGLAIFAVVTAGLIAVTQVSTADRIADAEKHARAKALYEVVPRTEHDNDMLAAPILLHPDPLLGAKDTAEAYLATLHGSPVAVILPFVAPDGYTGEIQGIVGVQPDGTVKGVRITAHKETPGLGDKIEARKSPWVEQFPGRSLSSPAEDRWKVKKDGGDFDQMTGATITPRAVVKAVRNALTYFQSHRDQLLRSNSGVNTATATQE